jgi:hypothetical protein
MRNDEKLLGFVTTKHDQMTKPGRVILVEREGRFGPNRSEFVVWWEETRLDGTPVVPGRGSGFYTDDLGDAMREFARRVRRESCYFSSPEREAS